MFLKLFGYRKKSATQTKIAVIIAPIAKLFSGLPVDPANWAITGLRQNADNDLRLIPLHGIEALKKHVNLSAKAGWMFQENDNLVEATQLRPQALLSAFLL